MDLPWGLSLLGVLLALHATILVPAEAHLEHLDQGDAYGSTALRFTQTPLTVVACQILLPI